MFQILRWFCGSGLFAPEKENYMYSSIYKKPDPYISIGRPWITNLSYIQASGRPDWIFYIHTHNAVEISYIFKGKGSLFCDGKQYEMKEGDIVVKNPQIPHAENTHPDDPLEEICILIEDLEIEGEPKNTFPVTGGSPVICSGEKKVLLEALFREILHCMSDKEKPENAYAGELLHAILTAVLATIKSEEWEQASDKDMQDRHTQEIRSYIEENYARDISLDSIADEFHFSMYYLARQFRKHMNYTVNNYIVSCRIGEAQRSLIHTDQSISDIALRCGFRNLSYFYTSFRKKVGCTPAEFKKLYRYPSEDVK